VAFVDNEAITKIISNLLNNALKYGKRTTIVNLFRDADSFILRVSSDGDKIKGEQRRRIFEAFYQEPKNSPRGGVGIGLSLSRSLAELQGGRLNLVNDDDDETNIFELVVPLMESRVVEALSQQPVLPDEEYVVEEPADSDAHELKFYTLLFVEDNNTMRDFISERLSEKFNMIKAENGKAALELLGANHVDLIVTDVVMPEMNGFDLCVAVKKDINLSHIPVVFLTAKNDIDSKVKGLKCGAEAYIEKPFSLKYFMQQIESLLDNRSREREAYSKNPFFTVSNMKTSKADEEFMNKVVKVIEDNMNDEKFNVETMMTILCMSRSSLMRKIKTLFNQSPLDLIRIVKLKKAAELIQDGHHRIGDVCYMVGINSPSYFSKLFYRQFGIMPKNFEKQRQSYGGDADAGHGDTIYNK
jgi:DNA-binding response OmpR family regulator